MAVLEELTACEDDHTKIYLRRKRKELAERLAMSYLAFSKQMENSKQIESAIDGYSKALKALENIPNADPRLSEKVGKLRAMAMMKKIEAIETSKHKTARMNSSDLSFLANTGELEQFGSTTNLGKQMRIGKGFNTAFAGSLCSPVSGRHSRQARAPEKYQVDSSGKYVIKKNNFLLNKRPVSHTQAKRQPGDPDQSSSFLGKEDEVLDAMDLGDIDNEDDVVGEVYPHLGSTDTVKPARRFHALNPAATYTTGVKDRQLATTIPNQEMNMMLAKTKHKNGPDHHRGQASSQDMLQTLDHTSQKPPLKNVYGMRLPGVKGYFVPEQTETFDYSKAVRYNATDGSKSKPVLGYGTMKVVRGDRTVVATAEERREVETHVIQQETKKLTHNRFGNASEIPQYSDQKKLEIRRLDFLAHLKSGEPIETLEKKKKLGESNEKCLKEKSPMNLNLSELEDYDDETERKSNRGKPGDSSALPGQAVSQTQVRNKTFFEKILSQAEKTRQREKMTTGKHYDGDESSEESIKNAEVDNKVDLEESIHSIHDSVQVSVEAEGDKDERVKALSVIARRIQRVQRVLLEKKRYLLKKEAWKDHYRVISRHFKAIDYRKSFGQSESKMNFGVTFKIDKTRLTGYQGQGEDLSRKGSDHHVLHNDSALPAIHIVLVSRTNCLVQCSGKIPLEKYIVDKSPSSVECLLTVNRLRDLCRQLLDHLFIVDDSIHFHQSLTSLLNSPLDLEEGGVHEKSTQDEELEEDSLSKSVRSKEDKGHRYEDDGCIYDSVKVESVAPPELNDEAISEIIDGQRRNKKKFKDQMAYYKDASKGDKPREIKFSGLAKHKDHYVNIICLINKYKQNQGEVHAFDFNQLRKMTPCVLKEKVLYLKDLNVPDIFRKIELDFQQNTIGITDFNLYQMKQAKILENLYNLEQEDNPILEFIAACAKRKVKWSQYKCIKQSKEKIKFDKNKQEVLVKFFKIYSDEIYVCQVEKDKVMDNKIQVKAKKQKSNNTFKEKVEPLELFSGFFKSGTSEMTNYVNGLKNRVMIMKREATEELYLSLEFGNLEDMYCIKDSKALKQEADERKEKNDEVDKYQKVV